MVKELGFLRYYRNAEKKPYCLKHCKGQSHASRKHAHEEFSIALVTGGESVFRFVDEDFVIRKGQMVIIGPNVVHQCCPKSVEAWSFYMLHISPLWLQEAGFDLDGLPDFAVSDLQAEGFEQIEQHFERACRYAKDAEEWIVLIMESAFSPQPIRQIEWSCNDSDERVLEGVYEHIQKRYKEILPLEELAQKSGMDRYTLIRKFNRKYNTTPHSWQIMLRVNEAKRMLENGCSISETSLEVGFYDQSHFSRVFKETYGVTPKQFVKSVLTAATKDSNSEISP